jgi:hypothetical protein
MRRSYFHPTPFAQGERLRVGEVKRIRSKKLPLTAAGVHALRDEYTRTIEPARAFAAKTLKLERQPSAERGVRNAECSGEIHLMWQTAPPRMPIPAPAA